MPDFEEITASTIFRKGKLPNVATIINNLSNMKQTQKAAVSTQFLDLTGRKNTSRFFAVEFPFGLRTLIVEIEADQSGG